MGESGEKGGREVEIWDEGRGRGWRSKDVIIYTRHYISARESLEYCSRRPAHTLLAGKGERPLRAFITATTYLLT